MNFATVLVLLALAAGLFFALRAMRRGRCRCGACNGDCGQCGKK